VWKAINDSSGLLGVHQRTSLSGEQKDADLDSEKAFFLQQAAVQQERHKTFQVFHCTNTDAAAIVHTME